MMDVQTAEAAADNKSVDKAPCEGTTFTSGVLPAIDDGNCDIGPQFNARIAIAPYAQVVAGSSYTFIGISHPSLATAHTSIGVVVEALGMTTVPDTASGRAAVFTVSAGETHRVFVVNQGHSTINGNNSAFTDSKTHLITTVDTNQYGHVRVTGIGTSPLVPTTTAARPGAYNDNTTSGTGATNVSRLDNVSQLSMWGVIYKASNGAGFALEFIGDMHDSAPAPSSTNKGMSAAHGISAGGGRGIN
mgnify:CR=1 FL=1